MNPASYFVLLFILIIFFCFVLVKATDLVLMALRSLVLSTGIKAFSLAAFVMALSTSLPELTIAISSSLQGNGALSLGNVLGANIANLSFVLGGAALVSGSLKATDTFMKKEIFYVLIAGALPLVLLTDGRIGRVEGILLLTFYVIWNILIFQPSHKKLTRGGGEDVSLLRRLLIKLSRPKTEQSLVMLITGMALMLLSSHYLVQLAVRFAEVANFPVLLVGLIILSVGTTLPELTFEIKAVRQKEVQMAFGNVLGSIVANSTVILGVAAVISPIVVAHGITEYITALFGFLGAFTLFWLFVRTKHRLDRWEGAILLLYFIGFTAWEIIQHGL